MQYRKTIKSRRRPVYTGQSPAMQGALWRAFYEIIRSFLKPKLLISLSLETNPIIFSSASPDNFFSDDTFYLLLYIKCTRKTSANFELTVTGYFYDDELNRHISLPLDFEKPPEVLENQEYAILRCLTPIQYQSSLRADSRISLKINYDYAYTGKIRSLTQEAKWSFVFNNGKLIPGPLVKMV